MEQITIIGAGQIGQAVGRVLINKEYHVEFWDSAPGKVKNQSQLEDIVPDSELIFLCVPSRALRQAIASVRPYLSSKNILVCFSKGMEADTSNFSHETIEGTASVTPYALFGGPMIAETLDRGGAGCVASKSEDVFKKISMAFDRSPVRVDYSRDVLGVAACGVLKNIYALGLGISDGLGLGENIRGWLASAAIKEMEGIVTLLGGEAKTSQSIAGTGDFLATAYSLNSDNRQTGEALVKTGKLNAASESVASIGPMTRRIGNKVADFKFFHKISEISLAGEKPEIGIKEFLAVASEYSIDND
ncbi:MAG TPA: NAD(P)-binding domain-containing protein [Candidatus Colwellbacteria bacterium]|nr:NAD(P)-binding domain-containing protein [Candidatus Colwellbacteria bacterium]